MIKQFLTNKDCEYNVHLIECNVILTDQKELVDFFNEHYLNKADKSSGLKPENIVKENNVSEDDVLVEMICKVHENHPSITKIFKFQQYLCFHQLNSEIVSIYELIQKAQSAIGIYETGYITKYVNMVSIRHGPYF